MFTLAMMNTAIVVGLEGLSEVGSFGLELVTYYALFTLCFFVPVGLVAAELGAGWPHEGGVYLWVKEALGQRAALVAVWCQWIQILVWYPTVLAVCAVSLAYAVHPALGQSPIFVVGVSLAVFWLATLVNFRGLHSTGVLTTWLLYLGTIVPVLVAIGLAGWWLLSGRTSAIELGFDALVPQVHSVGQFVGILAVFSFLSGLEANAVHFKRVHNPQKSIPRALLLSSVLVLLISVLGALSVAVMVPVAEIDLAAGTLQVFSKVLDPIGWGVIVPVIAVLALLGMIGHIMVWIIGPTESIRVAAGDGLIPPFMQRLTKQGAPRNVMLVQGVVVSAVCMLMLLDNLNAIFYILTIVSAQIYLVMYVLMFISAIVLRKTHPHVERAFRIPGGKVGIWIIAGGAALCCLAGIGFMFIPPDSEAMQLNTTWFTPLIGAAFVLVLGVPLMLYRFRKPQWSDQATPHEDGVWERGD
jgi:amino acid transporter